MAKKKIQKKKKTSKIANATIDKKINIKKKINHKEKKKNKTTNYKITNNKLNKESENNLTNKVTKEIKTNNHELEDKIDIPIIKKTINERKEKTKSEKDKANEINRKIIEETIEQKIEQKLDKHLEKKINEKISEANNNILPKKTPQNKNNNSRKLVKKEDVFSKITEWFNNLSDDINKNIRKRKVTNIKKNDAKNKRNKKKSNEQVKETKVYPKNKFLKTLVIIHDNLYIPFDTIIALVYIILIVGMFRVKVIPTATIKYIAAIVGFLSIVAMSLNKYISGRIFTIFITTGMLCGIYYLNYTYDFINNLNSKLYEYQEYYVVSLDNGRNKSIYNINNKTVGLLKENSRNVEHVLNTELDHVTYITYKNQDKLYEEFFESKTRAIIVKENQYKYIQNNNIKPNLKVKILYKFNVNTKKQGEKK